MQRQGDLHRDRTSASGIFDPQSRRRPPSPTPASSPTASPHLRDVAGLTIGSSKVWSVSAPRYLLLLLYGLPLRGSLLLRTCLRLRCFLRHGALLVQLSWRCRISTHANRRHCISITTAKRKKQLPD